MGEFGNVFRCKAKGGAHSVASSSEISARAASVFLNTSFKGDNFISTSSVNCGLQREDSSEKVVSRFPNTIIGEGEVLHTSSVNGGSEISGGLSNFRLVLGGDVINMGEKEDNYFTEGNKIEK